MTEKRTEVRRKETLTTEELIEHIKTVGQAIIDDAESIAIDTRHLRKIQISATISPGEQITEILYNRIADPRGK